MSNSVLTKSKRKTAADYKAIAEQMLDEISLLEEQMDRDHAESERLKAETQIIKAETEIIKVRVEATMAQLAQQVDRLAKAR